MCSALAAVTQQCLDVAASGRFFLAMGEADAVLTRETLRRLLAEEGHDPDTYSLEGRKDRRKYLDCDWVLDRWSNRWVVYFTERGSKRDICKYRTEDAACRALLGRLRGYDLGGADQQGR
jgi:hypothetical protein